MISLNIILTTIGRPTLNSRMLPSLVNQLQEQDILTVISDANHQYVEDCLGVFKFKNTVNHIKNQEPLGWWGHGSRNKYQNNLAGDYLMNADDDDRYVDGAFDFIRKTVKEDKLYLFRHESYGGLSWATPDVVRTGNIGTSCGVIPNKRNLPDWGYFYGGDGQFYEKLSVIMDYEFVDFVIYKVDDTQ